MPNPRPEQHEIDRRRVAALAAEVYTAPGVEIWPRNRNRLLGNESPDDLILRGETQRVLDVLDGMVRGAAT